MANPKTPVSSQRVGLGIITVVPLCDNVCNTVQPEDPAPLLEADLAQIPEEISAALILRAKKRKK